MNILAIWPLVLLAGAPPHPPVKDRSCGVERLSGFPYPQPCIPFSKQTTTGDLTTVTTGEGLFPPGNAYLDPPGTNLLPNVYTNMFDGYGVEMPNTLPSTPSIPFNLHDGPPKVEPIDRASPTSDLLAILDAVAKEARATAADAGRTARITAALKRAVDILEGNPISGRAYSGIPVLHYTAALESKAVAPIFDAKGKAIGGNVDVHQIFYDQHIESDTAFIDPRAVHDVPWTITYTIDVLDRGRDDFSPYVMYLDDPALTHHAVRLPHVGMDQTFFNVAEGTRTILKLKMAPGKYFSLSYSWGWRIHPPRIQVIENAGKIVQGRTTLQWEQDVFGENPRADEAAKLKAIGMIGDLAPSKRMWTAFRAALAAVQAGDMTTLKQRVDDARAAFADWQDRLHLPRGVEVDPSSDLTLLYADNTLYGQFKDGSYVDFPKWSTRGVTFKGTLRNADYFDHYYQNIDFGGARGWENQFKSSVKVGGSGCWFTFGRNNWWPNLTVPIKVPAADRARPSEPTKARVEITFNYDPARRLRFYQFDPAHHAQAVFSVH